MIRTDDKKTDLTRSLKIKKSYDRNDVVNRAVLDLVFKPEESPKE